MDKNNLVKKALPGPPFSGGLGRFELRLGELQGGSTGIGIAANLYGFMWVHLRWISLRLFRDLSSAIAIIGFSDRHRSQYLIPFL